MNYYPKMFNGSFLNDSVLMFKDEYSNLVHASIHNQGLNKKVWVKNITFVSLFLFLFLLFLILLNFK
jgi:hypothetical protein